MEINLYVFIKNGIYFNFLIINIYLQLIFYEVICYVYEFNI